MGSYHSYSPAAAQRRLRARQKQEAREKTRKEEAAIWDELISEQIAKQREPIKVKVPKRGKPKEVTDVHYLIDQLNRVMMEEMERQWALVGLPVRVIMDGSSVRVAALSESYAALSESLNPSTEDGEYRLRLIAYFRARGLGKIVSKQPRVKALVARISRLLAGKEDTTKVRAFPPQMADMMMRKMARVLIRELPESNRQEILKIFKDARSEINKRAFPKKDNAA